MNYRLAISNAVQRWIERQAKKFGLRVIKVNPAYTSTTCPKCGTLMFEKGYRTLRCPSFGFEENRDYIAVLNLYGRGLWPSRLPVKWRVGKTTQMTGTPA